MSTTTTSAGKTSTGAGAHSHRGLAVVLSLVVVLAPATILLGIPTFKHKYDHSPALGNSTCSSTAVDEVRTTYNARTDL